MYFLSRIKCIRILQSVDFKRPSIMDGTRNLSRNSIRDTTLLSQSKHTVDRCVCRHARNRERARITRVKRTYGRERCTGVTAALADRLSRSRERVRKRAKSARGWGERERESKRRKNSYVHRHCVIPKRMIAGQRMVLRRLNQCFQAQD